MDFLTLQQQLAEGWDGSTLTLTRGMVDSTAIDAVFDDVLGASASLVVALALRSDDENAETIRFYGTGDGVFASMTVEALFSLRDGEAHVTWTGTGDGGWTLATAMPELAGTAAATLPFTGSPTLALASYTSDADGVTTALWLSGDAVISSAFAGYAALLGDGPTQAMAGEIVLASGAPKFSLGLPDGAAAGGAASLGPFSVDGVSVRLDSSAVTDDAGKTTAKVTTSLVTGVGFTVSADVTWIPLTATVDGGSGDLLFASDLNDLIDSSLDEITALLDGLDVGALTSGLSGFDLADVLQLSALTVAVKAGSTDVAWFSGGIHNAQAWTLARNDVNGAAIAVPSVSLSATMTDPAGARTTALDLAATLAVGGGTVDLAASWPGFTVTSALAAGSTIQAADVFDLFANSQPDDLPTLTVTEFALTLTPGSSYSASVAFQEDWSVGADLSITPVSFAAAYDPGATSTVSIGGGFAVAGLDFTVSADYATGAGWRFEGTLGEALDLSTIATDLLNAFGTGPDVTLPDAIALDSLEVEFSPGAVFSFTGHASLQVGDTACSASFAIKASPQADGASYTGTVTGSLTVGTRTFLLAFGDDASAAYLAATYASAAGERISVRDDLVQPLSAAIAAAIPGDLAITVYEVLLAFEHASSSSTAFLFGIDVGIGLDLTAIPLIGTELPSDERISVDKLQVILSSADLTQAQVKAIDALLPASGIRLPDGGVARGANLASGMHLGGSAQTVAVPAPADDGSSATPPAPNPAEQVTSSDGAEWITLQKKFGPVHFNRIGVRYESGAAWFLLDAELSAAGLTLSMEGLSFGSSLETFDPRFDLAGVGIDYANDPVTIGGAFVRQTATNSSGESYDEYDGAVVLKTDALSLSALGSYAQLDGHPSLFVYGVLNDVLGGPPFFFVTGLAAGFGYNRALTLPPVDQVAKFPLVSVAVDGGSAPASTKDVAAMLSSLSNWLSPELDEVFLCAGVHFTSFKLVDSFVLAAVAFGKTLELDVLGLSTLVLPAPVDGEPTADATPLAEVQMAVRATYQPAAGFLGISAQLTSASYAVSRDCHLSGGFAFYSWFAGEHAGDFVLTLGGYHPDFTVPSHYPNVPRLGLAWKVSSELSIQGSLYCALTPSLLMAGGELKAAFEDGSLSAALTVGMDALIAWKPYHYDFSVHVDVSAKYTYHLFGKHHIHADVGATLHCWGPDFSGSVHIDLKVVSFTIPFGNDKSRSASAIPWSTFEASFLPAQVLSIAVTGGLVTGPTGDGDLGVADPRRFALVTNSVVPAGRMSIGDGASASALATLEADAGGSAVAFTALGDGDGFAQAAGTSALDVAQPAAGPVGWSGITSTHAVVVEREVDGDWEDASADFAFTPVLKSVPYALWGPKLTPGTGDRRMLSNALAGFTLTPASAPTPGASEAIDRDNLGYDQEDIDAAYAWADADAAFAASGLDDDARRDLISTTLASDAAASARAALCAALGVDATTLSVTSAQASAAATAFLAAPELYSEAA